MYPLLPLPPPPPPPLSSPLLFSSSSSSSVLFRDIIDLTQQVNRLDQLLNQLSEQNEVLRTRLGLGPEEEVNVGEVRERRERERERMREENRLLQREVGKEGRWVGGMGERG